MSTGSSGSRPQVLMFSQHTHSSTKEQVFMLEEVRWSILRERRKLNLHIRPTPSPAWSHSQQLYQSAQHSETVVFSCKTAVSYLPVWIAFFRSGSLYCFEYGVPSAIFLAKLRGGTYTIAQSDPSEVLVRTVMHMHQNGFGNYDIFEKNCEDFALYCKTGLRIIDEPGIGASEQASSAIGIPLAALMSSPFKIFAAGTLGLATVMAGMYCAGRCITDIGVRKDVTKVEVEDLSSHLGFQRIEDAKSVNNSPYKVKKTLLPMKRKRER